MIKLRQNPIVRLFSSIRFGVTILALLLIYASLGSALPQIRGAIEISEMDVFRHWIFATLILLFAACLITATLVRIRFNVVNLGVLTVHTGLLLLVGGSLYYFGTKVEGNVLLRTPSVDLFSIQGKNSRMIAQFKAEKGETWSNFMPAFGGAVNFTVEDIAVDDLGVPTRATLKYQSGSGEPKTILAERGQLAQTSDAGRLAVRLSADGATDEFYDGETPALYLAKVDGNQSAMRPINGLPLFRERYLDEGYVIKDVAGREVPTKRIECKADLYGIAVPTGVFEHWRMPIQIDSTDLPFDIKVTGYLPYISRFDSTVADGGSDLNPAAQLVWTLGTVSRDQSLFAFRPSQSMGSVGVPVEFCWVTTEAERNQIFQPLVGPDELEIKVKDAGISRRFAIQPGQSIQVEGTPYEIDVKEIRPDWPMMTPGFEGASSPMASIDVRNGKQSYNRTVIQRFPQLSQDIDEEGVRHREGPYDPNLEVRFRTSEQGWITLVAGDGREPELAVFDMNGAMSRIPLQVGRSATVPIMGVQLDVRLAGLYEKSREMSAPVLEPLETRRPNLGPRSASAVRIQFIGKGKNSGWSESQWCAFSAYPTLEPRTIRVLPPGESQPWEVKYSRLTRKLGCDLVPGKLSVTYFPGRHSVESWWSDFQVVHPGQAPQRAAVYTNATFSTGEWTLFQSGAANDNWSYTILGVGNRNGIWPMLLGCILVTIGCLYAFYVKPVIIHRAAARGKAQAAARRIEQPKSMTTDTAEANKPIRQLQDVH